MRMTRLMMCGLTAMVVTSPAWAQGEMTARGETTTPAAQALGPRDDVELIPSVKQGDQIGIACNALTKSGADSDVRVVLTISAEPGETPPGYKKVLATDAQVAHGAVKVRIPSVPDLEDRLVNVDVYVMDNGGAQSCDAGHVKIVRQKTPAVRGTIG
jgi:hypothetical protein